MQNQTTERNTQIVITLTEKAAEELKKLAQQHNIEEIVLRVQAIPGGCSGISYSMGFDEVRDGDIVVEQHGIKIVVDQNSVPFINGAEIDYVVTPFGEGFKINNPNAMTFGGGCSTCGTGSCGI
ncbi:MAG: iron-sulfur cluster assembly accessory protein [Gammaproteobacteria bacterium]|nr:MAG: iron-sulfur cluster assembly accessory protein [Gammaproteobacteria bacterium]RTZ70583.1 MAG: iron-sulfur cluster assembly accessory protein [Aquificaceae bacterium]